MEKFDIIIIGGGISGLATAHYLLKQIRERGKEMKLLLLEKEEELGGKMKTRNVEGFIIEEGPNGFLDNKPHTLKLVEELGIEEKLIKCSANAKKRYIYTRGRLRQIPLSPISFLFSSIISPSAKLRLMGELFVPPAPPDLDESLSQFATRRLGKEALETLLDPMVAGVYAGNPDHVSLKSTFPTIYRLEQEYKGLIKGMMKLSISGKSKGGPAGPGGTLTSFKGGVFDLISALEEELREIILKGTPINGLTKRKRTFELQTLQGSFETETLILATPAYSAARILMGIDEMLYELLIGIPYAPISVIALGYKIEEVPYPLDGYGFLVPRKENLHILGCLWDSSIFPNRAPRGNTLLRVMIGGDRQPHLALRDPGELMKMAKSDLKTIMGLESEPWLAQVFQHEKGIPQYVMGHSNRLEAIQERLKMHPGAFLNSNAYWGIGLNDCVANSLLTAEEVIRYLKKETI